MLTPCGIPEIKSSAYHRSRLQVCSIRSQDTRKRKQTGLPRSMSCNVIFGSRSSHWLSLYPELEFIRFSAPCLQVAILTSVMSAWHYEMSASYTPQKTHYWGMKCKQKFLSNTETTYRKKGYFVHGGFAPVWHKGNIEQFTSWQLGGREGQKQQGKKKAIPRYVCKDTLSVTTSSK